MLQYRTFGEMVGGVRRDYSFHLVLEIREGKNSNEICMYYTP